MNIKCCTVRVVYLLLLILNVGAVKLYDIRAPKLKDKTKEKNETQQGCGVAVGKQTAQRRIVGGDDAGFGTFPWQAYIRIGSSSHKNLKDPKDLHTPDTIQIMGNMGNMGSKQDSNKQAAGFYSFDQRDHYGLILHPFIQYGNALCISDCELIGKGDAGFGTFPWQAFLIILQIIFLVSIFYITESNMPPPSKS